MSGNADLEAAAAEALAARARLMDTAHELQARLDPGRLLDEAVTNVKDGAAGLAHNSVEAAKRRPGVAAAAGFATVALLLRRPLARLGRRLAGRAPKETS